MLQDMDELNLCGNIRFLRKKHGLTQAEMAEIMHISVYALHRMEKNILSDAVGADALISTARYFRLRVSDLFYPLNEQNAPGQQAPQQERV